MYDNLRSELHIRNMRVRNRIMLTAMGTELCEPDGCCGEPLIAYYEARARGGVGLIMLETSSVAWPAGTSMPRMVGVSGEAHLPGLEAFAERMHRHGAMAGVQLNHAGKVASEDRVQGRPLLVPSVPHFAASDMFEALTQQEIASFVGGAAQPVYQVMTQEDIDWLVGRFAAAAGLAQRAGLDCVEIHAGHGYVLSSFLSPHYNQRSDAYGGSANNRARLLVEVLRAVRAAVGADFPILCRIDATEFRVADGITIEDAIVTARLAVAAGCDAIDVSAYANSTSGIAFTEAPIPHQPGAYLGFAEAIRHATGVPVIAVGRIEPDVADQGIGAGRFDMVAMGRKLLADPELPNKLQASDPEAIRPCIYCYVCVSQIFLNRHINCAVNPATGREAEIGLIAPAVRSKRVVVVGGGPAGLEAARVAALRGHEVTLIERDAKLGGTARIAALAYEPNAHLVRHLEDAIRRLPVIVCENTIASADSVAALAPDAVLVATGARRRAPPIPGGESRHVFDGDELRGLLLGGNPAAMRKLGLLQRGAIGAAQLVGITRNLEWMRALSRIYMPLGRRVVIIGGGLVGLEVAELLSERGRVVTVLEPGRDLGAELSLVRRWRVLHTLQEHGVRLLRQTMVSAIDATHVNCVSKQGAERIAADSVIIALGAVSDTTLCDELNARGIRAETIGDCREIGYIQGAISAGFAAAMAL